MSTFQTPAGQCCLQTFDSEQQSLSAFHCEDSYSPDVCWHPYTHVRSSQQEWALACWERPGAQPSWSWDGAVIWQEEKRKSGACTLSPSVADDRQVKVSTALIQSDSSKRCLCFWGATQVRWQRERRKLRWQLQGRGVVLVAVGKSFTFKSFYHHPSNQLPYICIKMER